MGVGLSVLSTGGNRHYEHPHHLVVTWSDVTHDVPHFRAVVISHRRLDAGVWTRSVAAMDDGLHVQIGAVDGGVLFQSDDLPDPRAQPPVPLVSRALADRRLPVEIRMWLHPTSRSSPGFTTAGNSRVASTAMTNTSRSRALSPAGRSYARRDESGEKAMYVVPIDSTDLNTRSEPSSKFTRPICAVRSTRLT